MQAEVVLPNGTAVPQGAPFRPLATRASAAGACAAATLFVPDAGAYGEGATGRMVSPDGGAPVEAAWERMMAAGLQVRACGRAAWRRRRPTPATPATRPSTRPPK